MKNFSDFFKKIENIYGGQLSLSHDSEGCTAMKKVCFASTISLSHLKSKRKKN